MKLKDLPVIQLEGAPYERGLVHGESLRETIKDVFWGWQYMVEKVTGESLAKVSAEFCEQTRFAPAIEKWVPSLMEEIRGIADGSGIAFNDLYMFNCTDENEWFLDYRSRLEEMPEPRGCSSFGVQEPAGTWIGQNMDIPGATDGYQALLHMTDDESGIESYVFTLAGMVGMVGVSNAPVGVVNNSLKQLRQRADGLPVNAVVRGLLAQKSFEDAKRFITSAPHATGHNYVVGGTTGAAMFECSANKVVEVGEGSSRLVHTNHPLENDDLLAQSEMAENRSSSNTHARLSDISGRFDSNKAIDLAAMKEALSSHDHEDNPVCRHVVDRKTSFSAGALIYELSTPVRLHFAPGPPCETEFGCWELNPG